MKKENIEHNVYFLRDVRNQELAQQFERSRSVLSNNNTVENNYNVFQGEMVYYTYYDLKRNKAITGLAIVLEDSRDYQNEVFICPLIPIKKEEDRRLGVPFGKVFSLDNDVEFVAAVGGIRRVNKNYVKQNNMLANSWVHPDFVNRVINMYKNLLDTIINKQVKITRELTC